MTTASNDYLFMPSANPNELQVVELLAFNVAGKVLTVASSKTGSRTLPYEKKPAEVALADHAVTLALNLGLCVTKLAPIYGSQKNGSYKVTFLIQHIDCSVQGPMAPQLPNGDKCSFADFFSLCSKDVSPDNFEYYRAMVQTLLAHIFPVLPLQ